MADEIRPEGARVEPEGVQVAPKEPRPAQAEEVRTVETHEGIAIAVEEEKGPPIREVGVREWVRENLFPNRWNGVLTIVFAALLGWVVFKALSFVLVTGRWRIVEVNLALFMVGRFPRSQLWRLVFTLLSSSFLISLWVGRVARSIQEAAVEPQEREWRAAWTRVWPFLVLVAGILVFTRTITPALLLAAGAALVVVGYWIGIRLPLALRPAVDIVVPLGIVAAFYLPLFNAGYGYGRWGGLFLNVFAAAVGIAASFPIGVALALGRRSRLPGIRVVCVAYIELIRGVPLITLLLMAFFVVGFLFPPGFRPQLMTRALVVIVAFTAAYVAEIVRGGLQSVPRGQIEAGQAVGLSPWKVTRRIVLPQALRNVIPALVGQFISLFKDTSLLFAIGILEALRAAAVVLSQPGFRAQGLQAETHAFAAFLFWIFAYAMSKESQRLERRLGLGER